jgi:ankyrin repeat protein
LTKGSTSLGRTPLHFAAAYNPNPEVIRTLVELGADHEARTLVGRSAWDLIQENEALKGTPDFWRPNDLSF